MEYKNKTLRLRTIIKVYAQIGIKKLMIIS